MRRQLRPAIVMVLLFTVLTGLVYGLAVTGFAQVVFPHQANGSMVEVDGKEVGSELIGQAFVDQDGKALRDSFQSRPSAADYDPHLSLGSNLGPTNPKLQRLVERRARAYRELNGLAADAKVPVDAVTASGSGLDPHISVANARIQAKRVADERGLSLETVRQLIDDHTDQRALGVLGEDGVNVLELNVALDRALDRAGPKS
jgi:K+-transporting ATPase ATPase C chain